MAGSTYPCLFCSRYDGSSLVTFILFPIYVNFCSCKSALGSCFAFLQGPHFLVQLRLSRDLFLDMHLVFQFLRSSLYFIHLYAYLVLELSIRCSLQCSLILLRVFHHLKLCLPVMYFPYYFRCNTGFQVVIIQSMR